MKARLTLAIVLASSLTAAAQPFGAARSEFRVNAATTGLQIGPDIVYHAAASFLVVWAGEGPGDGFGVFSQRYGFADPIGGELRISTYTPGAQGRTRVGASPSSSGPQYVVVWESLDQDGDLYGVFAQRYGSAGPVGPEFQVNTHTTGTEAVPDVAIDANGEFVVVWEQPDGDGEGIFARRYSSAGAPLTSPFRVNTYTTSVQRLPQVAKSRSGDFVVVWQSAQEFGVGYDIVGRRFSSAGGPLDDDFRIEGTTSESHEYPSVAAVGIDAGFVVAWTADQPSSKNVFARRYDASGAPLTSPFRVNTYTTDDQSYPSVAADDGSHITVVWRSLNQDGDAGGIYAQRYDPTGAPAGGEMQVNAFTTGMQRDPRVSMPSVGWFTVVWNDASQDGSGYGVFGRQFCSLQGDANGDDALTVQDIFYLINNLFAGGPNPLGQVDPNGDHVVDVQDVFYLINYLFAGGSAPGCNG
jgi:hypothetical protein